MPATPLRVKAEPVEAVAPGSGSPSRGRKRPRRSAAAVNSYAVPDSDDEAIAAEEDRNDEFAEFRMGGDKKKKAAKVGTLETHLEAWIKALGELHKEEQRKVSWVTGLLRWR